MSHFLSGIDADSAVYVILMIPIAEVEAVMSKMCL